MKLVFILLGLFLTVSTFAQEAELEEEVKAEESAKLEAEINAEENTKLEVKRDASYYYSSNNQRKEVSYRFMKRVLLSDPIPDALGMLPTEIDVNMHLVGLRIPTGGPWNLEVATTFLQYSIDLEGMGRKFNADLSGLGDTRLGVFHKGAFGKYSYKLDLGLLLPTGSIDQEYKGRWVGYNGQLGSGTYDFNPIFTYRYAHTKWTFSNVIRGKFRIGKNSKDYVLGNEIFNSFSVRYDVQPTLFAFLKFNYKNWGKVDAEKDLMMQNNPKLSSRFTSDYGYLVYQQYLNEKHNCPCAPVVNKDPKIANNDSIDGHTGATRKEDDDNTGGANPVNPPSKIPGRPDYSNLRNIDQGAGGSYFETVVAMKYVIPTGSFRYVRPTIEMGKPVYTTNTGSEFQIKNDWYVHAALETFF